MTTRNRKIVLGILLMAVIFGFSGVFYISQGAETASNQSSEKSGSGGTVIKAITITTVYIIALGVGYLASAVGSIFLTVIGGLLDFVIKINNYIIGDYVTTGWEIVLSITNLGFVLAIIVIAFATILRRETYAIKQTLGKLIVAALLVNFSLVIAGAFVDVANLVTRQFYDEIVSDEKLSLSGVLNKTLKVQVLGDFRPWDDSAKKGIFNNIDCGTLWPNTNSYIGCKVAQAVEKAYNIYSVLTKGGDVDLKVIAPLIAAAFFAAFFTFLIIIAFLALTLMMSVRYIYLGVLLILSPIVWLLWIFPATIGEWSKWWRKFLQWTFFAPIVMFFLYVAVGSINVISPYITKQDETALVTALTIKQEALAKGGWPFTLSTIGQMAIVLGLIFAGMIAANQMGITGSDLGIKLAKGAGKKFGAWSGRMALRGASAIPRISYKKKDEPEAKSLAQRFQESKLAKIGGPFNPLAWASRGVTGLAAYGSSREVARYEKMHAGKSAAEMRAALNTALGPERVALIKLLGKKEATEVSDISPSEKKRFARYDQEKEYREVEKSLQMPTENAPLFGKMAAITKKYGGKEPSKGTPDRGEFEKLSKQVEENNDALFGEMSAKDFSKSQINKVYTKKASGLSEEVTALRSRFAFASMSRMRPEAISTIVAGLKGKNIIHFIDASETTVNETIGSFIRTPEYQDLKRTNEDLAQRLEKLSKAKRENVEERVKYRQEMRDLMEKFGYLKGSRMMNALTKSMAKHSLETPFMVGKEEET